MSEPVLSGRSAMLRGAFWALAMRWSIKGLGLISTVLLARLLLPSDYGLVAMAMLVVGLVTAVSDFGVATAILREAELTADDADSAWTLSVLQLSCLGLLIGLAAPFAAAFFDEPRVQSILLTIAVCQLLTSTGSIGVLLARREFNFSLEFRYHASVKLVSVIVTLVAAWLLRDYRALVIGIASSYLLGWVLGYAMHPYRPRWNTSGLARLWRFGRWVLVAGVGTFIARRCDELLAGKLGRSDGLGLYAMGSELGQIVTAEVGPAMLKAMLPVLARMENPAQQRAAVLKSLTALNALTLPAGIGLALVASDVVAVLLGESWRQAAVFLQYFAVLGAMQVMSAPVSQLLMALGDSKALARVVWSEFGVFLLTAALLVHEQGLVGLALARLVASVVGQALTFSLGVRRAGFALRELCGALIRPLLACACMLLALVVMRQVLADVALAWRLWGGIVSGALVYAVVTLGIWQASGKPDGLERIVLQALQSLRASCARGGR